MSVDFPFLCAAIAEHAAFRRRQRLQPVGGANDKVLPPTYPGETRTDPARHVFEKRRIAGADMWTVLLDSVQSSANRSEETILAEARRGNILLPYLTVDFRTTEVPEIGEITSLDAPHRIFDAILRDSELDGKPLMKSELGQELQLANLSNATAIFQASPNALLFGAWNSTGEGGGLGAKFPRCFVSEIIGVNVPVEEKKDAGDVVSAGRRPGSRIDPLGILKGVDVYKKDKKNEEGPSDWSSELKTGYKKSKPSEINHGNIAPSIDDLGVTMDYAEHTMVISFAGLRRLQFGGGDRDITARATLAALGLVAHLGQMRNGYALRSRCDLVCDGTASLELVRFDGVPEPINLSYDEAVHLYNQCIDKSRKAGFTIPSDPIRLVPQHKLVYLVKKSRELALAGKGGEAEGTPNAGT